LNRFSVSELDVGSTVTLPPFSLALRPLDLSQARKATSWVLPSCGVATFLLTKSEGCLMLRSGRTMSSAPALAAPATMRSAVGLHVAVDRRVGADIRRIDLSR